MKREIPILLVIITGFVMMVQFFVPHEASEFVFTYANDFVIVIGILSLPIGIYSLVRATSRKARFEPKERIYSFATLAGFLIMVLSGLDREWSNAPHGLHRQL